MRIWLLSGSLLAASAALAGEPATATLDVPGMYCSLCSISVRTALERVPGVVAARADNAAKRAEVRYDPAKVTADDVAEALTRSGYPASVRRE
jgi:mercuric ion binding protein